MQKNTFYIEIYTNFVQAYTVCIFKTGTKQGTKSSLSFK